MCGCKYDFVHIATDTRFCVISTILLVIHFNKLSEKNIIKKSKNLIKTIKAVLEIKIICSITQKCITKIKIVFDF